MFRSVKVNGVGGAYSLTKTKTHYYFHLSFPHKEDEKVIVLSKIGKSIRIISKGEKDGKTYVIVEMRMLLFKNEKSAIEYLKDALIVSKS
jgi:hypothetical protein